MTRRSRMRRYLVCLLLASVAGCGSSSSTPPSAGQGGPARVWFTTPEKSAAESEIAHALVGFIDQCKTTIDVAAFELDNKAITDALVRAVHRGVRVRLVTETN